VPGKAFTATDKLPVVNWIYGGAYLLGGKDQPQYDGTSILQAANNSLIFVAGNYRVSVSYLDITGFSHTS
jgi:carboxylesterase type B